MAIERPARAQYQRVVEAIKQEIRSGDLKVGTKLDGNRAIAKRYDVALGTAQKALGVLQEEGWLISTPSVGVFVSAVADENEDEPQGIADEVAALKATVVKLSARVDALETRS